MKAPIFVFLLAIWLTLVSAVPSQMNYQGKLTTTGGVALNGSYGMVFRIYDASSGGTMIWSESYPSVTITKGLFDVVLGSITPINLPFDAPYWLEIVVDGEVFAPRISMSSVGYAFRAAYGDSAAMVRWGNIQDIPAGFADGIDNVDDADNVVGNEVVTALTFDPGTGNLRIDQNAGTPFYVASLDGRYLTSEVDGSTSNELITAASYTHGTHTLRITEAGADWDVDLSALDDVGSDDQTDV